MGRVLKPVAVGLRTEIAAILRVQTAARIVLVMRRGCATCKSVQVGLVGADEPSG